MDVEKGRFLNFTHPLKRQDFSGRLDQLKVSLEDIIIQDFSVNGTVRVRNVAHHKEVTVRYTFDGWSSYKEVVGQYIEKSHTASTDNFAFEIAMPTTLLEDCKLEFAICYSVPGVEFWDNNDGDNYRVMCYSSCLTVAHNSPSKVWKYILHYIFYILEKIRSMGFTIDHWIDPSFWTGEVDEQKQS
ncbi:protein phosphatase 1 regulatory subunit 3B-B-like [Montipora capricornis]|uniref:protein phosphatase 1 regulatory subunit 3B-B-like n=1 Tax=Montipora capricornis TaxID=246305 RepID=UPI0035F17672